MTPWAARVEVAVNLETGELRTTVFVNVNVNETLLVEVDDVLDQVPVVSVGLSPVTSGTGGARDATEEFTVGIHEA